MTEFKAHEDIIRKIVLITDDTFATCSNDQLIKIWDMKGNNLCTIPGHDSLIYALAYHPLGYLISGGEDAYLKIWKND